MLMDNRNRVDNKGLASVSDEQIDQMLSEVEKPDFLLHCSNRSI